MRREDDATVQTIASATPKAKSIVVSKEERIRVDATVQTVAPVEVEVL